MFIIKIKVKGKLRNLTENTEELINVNGIKNTNTISYILNEIKHKLIIEDNKITLLRENLEFSHGMIFIQDQNKLSEYYLKENNYSIEFNILTTYLLIENNKIEITYKIAETEQIYNYVIEMSDDL